MGHVCPMSSDIFSIPYAINAQVNPLHTETVLSCRSRTLYTLFKHYHYFDIFLMCIILSLQFEMFLSCMILYLSFVMLLSYHISGFFSAGKFWQKGGLEGVFNFHRVLFSLLRVFSMKK